MGVFNNTMGKEYFSKRKETMKLSRKITRIRWTNYDSCLKNLRDENHSTLLKQQQQ